MSSEVFCHGLQVSAFEIQTQQLQTILTKRANDTRAAATASDEVLTQVGPSFAVRLEKLKHDSAAPERCSKATETASG